VAGKSIIIKSIIQEMSEKIDRTHKEIVIKEEDIR
jgi:uncharacterized protein YlzI (FlbEa/FlbD family)